jgi:hypothetical protein
MQTRHEVSMLAHPLVSAVGLWGGEGVHSIIRRSGLTRVAVVANVSTDSLKMHSLSHVTGSTSCHCLRFPS